MMRDMPATIEDLLAEYPVSVALSVQWGEMDAYQHVNNATYFRYFETARMAFLSASKIIDPAQPEARVGPILASTSCRFKAPLRFPDQIYTCARVADIGDDRFTMEYAVISTSLTRVAATGDGLVVAYDYQQNQKASLPAAWRAGIAAVADSA